MAVVRNLMIRIGADYSAAQKGMQGATRELGRFKRDVTTTTSSISGKKGLGGIGSGFKSTSSSVMSSLSRIRGAKGIGGVVAELRSLTPAAGAAAKGMSGLGVAAGGAAATLGGAVVVIAALVSIVGIAAVALHRVSQPAVKFEADLGRLNGQLKEGSREFVAWARSQGLAKQSAVQMGATYSTLLSSFIKDTKDLQGQTAQFVQATRIVASHTGRSITDVTERMRSGLLGNTESIEDLGVFVNVAMIESTDAFRKFAGDKSWDQIDFQMQQQIRLAAILEQTYKRYGNELQNNVMTKQEKMTEQLKDAKLHLSQMALPIWDSILPALTRFSQSMAFVTEKLARFFYALRGWDYDEMTSGMDEQAGSSDNLGDSLSETEKKAKKAQKALAAFDQLNLIGETGGDGSGTGTGGDGGGTGLPNWGDASDGSGSEGTPPWIANAKKWRLEFDTPNPPDAGAGAVVTEVIATVDSMNAQLKLKTAQMWGDMQAQAQVGSVAIPIPWNRMWQQMGTQSTTTTTQATSDWNTMFKAMLLTAVTNSPLILGQWNQILTSVASIKNPLDVAKTEWKGTLSYMQQQLNAYRPYLEWGWHLIKTEVGSIKSPLKEVETTWSTTLSGMESTATLKLGGILATIASVTAAWTAMKQVVSGQPAITTNAAPATTNGIASNPALTDYAAYGSSSSSASATNVALDKIKASFSNAFSLDATKLSFDKFMENANEPGFQAGLTALSILPAGKMIPALTKGASAGVGWMKKLLESFKNAGAAIPAFAGGAVVNGPTLAMVGDNRNAGVDPEVIAPLSKLEAIMGGGDNSDVVAMLQRVEQAIRENKTIQAVISANEVTRAAIKGINDESRRTGRTPLHI